MTADRSVVNYIREASRLRHAIAVSEQDERFARDGGHVHYLLDTNVVGMFMRPQRHIDQLGMFSGWLDRDTLTATATLTSEFLLSRNLPGQNQEPALLSPDHYEELIFLAGRAAAALEALTGEQFEAELTELDASKAKIAELVDYLQDAEIEATEKLKSLNAMLPREVAAFVSGPLAELLQLKRVFEEGAIRRVDSMPWFHAAGLNTDARDELRWYHRVRNSRLDIQVKQSPFDFPRRHPATGLTINQMNDARTLAQLVHITKEFAGDGQNHRFLFVTADSAIRHAIETYVLEQVYDDERGQTEIFIRHPREFVPLLNLANISGDEELRAVFGDLKLAVDELLTGLTPRIVAGGVYVEPSDGEILGSLAAKGSVGSARTDRTAREKLDALERLWGQACRSALTPGIGLLRQRDEFLFGEIAELLAAPDLREHVRVFIVEAIAELLKDHAGLNVDGLFAAVSQLGTRRSEEGVVPDEIVLRVPLPLVRHTLFEDYLGSTDLNSYLLQIARGRDVSDLSRTVLHKGRDPVAYLFLACVCLAVGMWDAAKDFAQRARTTRGARPPSREVILTAQYVLSVAVRMALRSREELRSAERLLQDCVAKHLGSRATPEEARLALRAEGELAAIKLAAVEHSLYAMAGAEEFHQRALVRDRDIAAYVKAAGNLLTSVIHSVENNFSTRQAELAPILLQSYSNAAALSIIARVDLKAKRSRSALEFSDTEIIEGIVSTMQQVQYVPPTVPMYLDVLVALTESDRNEAQQLRRAAIETLTGVRERASILPRIDIEVAALLTDALRAL